MAKCDICKENEGRLIVILKRNQLHDKNAVVEELVCCDECNKKIPFNDRYIP